jgi:hypothetical protein
MSLSAFHLFNFKWSAITFSDDRASEKLWGLEDDKRCVITKKKKREWKKNLMTKGSGFEMKYKTNDSSEYLNRKQRKYKVILKHLARKPLINISSFHFLFLHKLMTILTRGIWSRRKRIFISPCAHFPSFCLWNIVSKGEEGESYTLEPN